MVSDHAEKLLDVSDVLSGQTGIYPPQHRAQAFQMYDGCSGARHRLRALLYQPEDRNRLCGVLTLPFIYLLGKEIGNRQVGLWAMVFAGIAYWPNLISRIALRFTLYPFFYAPAVYFLVRGLQRRSLNDFILSGIFVGLGLHGYSPYRLAPIVLAVGVALYLLHRQSTGFRRQAAIGLLVTALVSLYIFLPLLRCA
jgi:asparagine N-glycosylation enzyme membrane subunit Stt3